jgi:hypothetical protein
MCILQFQEYTFPPSQELEQRVNYLQRVINEPLDSSSEIVILGLANKEWALFSYSFSSYAMTSLALRDTAYKQRAAQIIKSAIDKVLDEIISGHFGAENIVLHKDSVPPYSVLYLGHLNLMLGCYRLIAQDGSYNNLHDAVSRSLYTRYKEATILNLESYPQSIWVPDNTVALASLKIHSSVTGSSYGSMCNEWIEHAKKNLVDKKTGLLCSTIDPKTGKMLEEPRGSMLGWSIMFIYQFNDVFAADQYRKYKESFSRDIGVLRLFRERYDRWETGSGDIDSGPLFLGFSIPANQFALCGSIMSGDYHTAKKLERLITIGTQRIMTNNEMKYTTIFPRINISPMAEALMLFSLTATQWTAK